MFVDEAIIFVKAGNGGRGCVSFRREKYVPRGGPDGGNGGAGGSVHAVVDPELNTLLEFAGRHHWAAQNGRPGSGNNRMGRSGEDVVIRVPPGTLIFDRDTGVLLKDLSDVDGRVCVARGGRGGRGNAAFATPTWQAPRRWEEGQPGEARWLRLELKLIADVGIIGRPNAGKSTLLSRLSRARPKIADYPFTTLAPQLGIVELDGYRRFVIVDIPGLIEGAHEGAGLGDTFLRHVERTRVLLHLVDLYPPDGAPTPDAAYRQVRSELEKFSPALAAKPELLVANKLDLHPRAAHARKFAERLGREVIGISAVAGTGLAALAERLWSLLETHRRGTPASGESSPAPHEAAPTRMAEP